MYRRLTILCPTIDQQENNVGVKKHHSRELEAGMGISIPTQGLQSRTPMIEAGFLASESSEVWKDVRPLDKS